jgi:arylformamidase
MLYNEGMSGWIDVTRVLSHGMCGWPGDPPVQLLPAGELGSDKIRVTEIRMSAHIGTHVDAPLHCFARAHDVADLPLDHLCGPAIVVDVSGPNDITVDDLCLAGILPGDRVLLKTADRSPGGDPPAAWPAGDRPSGEGDAENPSSLDFQALTPAAARWLVDRSVRLVGVDSLSPDRPDGSDLPVHRILLGSGVVLVEGLRLDRAPAGRYEMVALPLPLRGCEASPARVLLRPVQGPPLA